MMSTTGRMPVMAAPTPMPVMPASEIGESITRAGPNSSTSPSSTLNGVPASSTSSPMMNTAGSRRSSSRRASLMACPNVSSRVPEATCASPAMLGVDMLIDLERCGIGCRQGELHAGLDGAADARLDGREVVLARESLLAQPRTVQRDRIAIVAPRGLLVARAVVRAIDVPHVMAVQAVGLAHEEAGPLAAARALDGARRSRVDGPHVLAVDGLRGQPEGLRARGDAACGRLAVVRVLAVEVVLAHVDDGQLPQRRHVHDLVEQALAERALAE